MAREFDMDRRAYLSTVGAAGMAGIAGCPDDRDGDENDTDTQNDTSEPGDDAMSLATAADFPPFAYTEEGALVGFDVELAETVVERAGYEVDTWVDIRFDALVTELNAEQFDLVAAAVSVTERRQEEVAFSTPYYETDQSVVVASNGEFDPEEESDLEGRLVGAQSGTTSAAEVDRLVESEVVDGDDYRQFADFSRSMEALVDGDLEAVFVDRSVGSRLAAEGDVEVAFTIETGEEYALAMRTDDDRREDVDEALTEVMEDGTYEDLVAEYVE